VQRRLDAANQRLDQAAARLGRPLARLGSQEVRLGRAAHRLHYAMQSRLERERGQVLVAQQMLAGAVRSRIDHDTRVLERHATRMELLDPKLVLQRGYALLRAGDGTPITSAQRTHPGDSVTATLADGEVDLTVRATR
jgi:exodeoxyribonuclease VII large subunit